MNNMKNAPNWFRQLTVDIDVEARLLADIITSTPESVKAAYIDADNALDCLDVAQSQGIDERWYGHRMQDAIVNARMKLSRYERYGIDWFYLGFQLAAAMQLHSKEKKCDE